MKTVAGEHKDLAALIGVDVSNVRHALLRKSAMYLAPLSPSQGMAFTVEEGRWLILTRGKLSVSPYDESGGSVAIAPTEPNTFANMIELTFTRGGEPVLPLETDFMMLNGDLFLVLPAGDYELNFTNSLSAGELTLSLTVRLSGFLVSAADVVVDGTLLLSVN